MAALKELDEPRFKHKKPDHPPKYTIYTKTFDQIAMVDELVSKEDFPSLRKSIDNARREKRGFASLSRFLSKDLRAVFEESSVAPQDTVVSLLADNSGSMRGYPIMATAIIIDMLATKMELLGIRTEILGHTTVDWKGGQARQHWLDYGKDPVNPGRLNALRHIIYKDAQTPWRGGVRKKIGGMIKESLLRENVDGEALQWAGERLLNIPAKRRILIYIGDMAPVDDATLAVNDGQLLARHFKSVAKGMNKRGEIELGAIGLANHISGAARPIRKCFLVYREFELLAELGPREMSRGLSWLFVPPSPQ